MEWGLAFDLGKVENSKYGTALNLKGELAVFPGKTDYKLPAILQDRTRFDRVARELATKYRDCFPGSSEAKAMLRVSTALLSASYQNPFLDYDSHPAMAAYTDFMVIGFAFDDVVDNVLKIQDGILNYRTFLAFISSFGNPELDVSSFIPRDSGNPESPLSLFRTMLAWYTKAFGEVKSFASDSSTIKYLNEELLNSGVANYLTFASKSATPTVFSNRTFSREIGQQVHGMRIMLEAAVMVNPGGKLPAHVRRTLLFKILMDSYGHGTALVNAIVGMTKDIREDTWEDTPLLRDVVEGGLTLQESFDNTVAAFKAEVEDMHLAMEILRETYGDIEGVNEFLETTTHSFMGTCLAYGDKMTRDRYPGTEIDIITKTVENPLVSIKPHDVQVCKNRIKLAGKNGMYFEFNPNDTVLGELLIGYSKEIKNDNGKTTL